MDIDDDLLLKMRAENVCKPTAKSAKSACRFYAAEKSETHEWIVLGFIEHIIHSQIKC